MRKNGKFYVSDKEFYLAGLRNGGSLEYVAKLQGIPVSRIKAVLAE